MAHEINNPLAGVVQNIAVLENRLLNPESNIKNIEAARAAKLDLEALKKYLNDRKLIEIIESIRISGLRISSIISNMLNFSRKDDMFKINTLHELIDSSLILAATDFNIEQKFDFKAIEIVKDFNSKEIKLNCNKAEIQQVLLNIFHNAAQAMILGNTETPKIIITTSIEGSRVVIEIKDNGPGISSKDKEDVLKPFFSTENRPNGTGLGLSIADYIITNHNGELFIESELKDGVKVVITLPYEGA
ncbi:HAMP domain-containing histidine kinase [Thiospirochaeta perfilievii]|uniref:histidine kinase n=1 Tax=Thiospirochaeta perfilievii TaxID=252967 RepID=A0A5C1QGX5_9SPIO|nr:HAMP domain-containing histidine kinase [Thiospirochaeta perfilievii]